MSKDEVVIIEKDGTVHKEKEVIPPLDLQLFGGNGSEQAENEQESSENELEEDYRTKCFNCPTSPTANIMRMALRIPKNKLKETMQTKNARSKKNRYEITENVRAQDETEFTVIQRKNGTETDIITIENKPLNSNRKGDRETNNKDVNLLKLFEIILNGIFKKGEYLPKNEKGIDIEVENISFPLQHLVNLKMYSNVESAYKGVVRIVPSIQRLKHYHEDVGEEKVFDIAVPLIIGGTIKRDTVYIHYTRRTAWKEIFKCYAPVPEWVLGLSQRAYTLMLMITNKLNLETVYKSNSKAFKIRCELIAEELGLPKLENTKNPTRDITKAIEDTVDEIMDMQRNNGIEDYVLEITTDIIVKDSKSGNNKKKLLCDMSTKEYLTDAYLDVKIKGNLKERYEQIKRSIEKEKKKKEKIEERAQIEVRKEAIKYENRKKKKNKTE